MIGTVNRKRFTCPECGRNAGVEIVYGYPTRRLFRQAERRDVVLGGCIVRNDDPNAQCLECHHRWSHPSALTA